MILVLVLKMWEYVLLQKVEVGLQSQALKLFCEGTRKAEEELQSYSQECVEQASIIETYMALANFCDKRLREEEQRDSGKKLLSTKVAVSSLIKPSGRIHFLAVQSRQTEHQKSSLLH